MPFVMAAASGWAQGANTGMGGRDEGVASILEKLKVMDKKNDAFNIFLNTNMAYEENLGSNPDGGFKGRHLRFEARGFLDEHWSYRLRFKFESPWEKQDDGLSNSLDILMVNYQVNKRLRLKAGKQALGMGGFEYDANAIQVLDYSDFNANFNTSLIGMEVAYDVAKGQEISLAVSNANNNSIDKVYPGAGLQETRHPLAVTVNWMGNRLWDKLENHWSYTYMHADTLFSELQAYVAITVLPIDSTIGRMAPDTLRRDSTYRQLRAFHNVRIYNKEYQTVSDSAVYNGLDSIITLYHDPVLWSDKQQVSADVIHIYIRNELADYAHGVGNAIAIKHEARDMFDQMQGKEMFAYIRDGEIRQVDVSGNAETIFYPREEDGTFTGVNKTQSSLVKLYLKDQKIERIVFTTTTNGTMYPLDQIKDTDRFLNAFFWAKKERPRDPMDVFRHAERTPRPKEKAVSAVVEEELDATENPRKQKEQRNKKRIDK